MTMLGLVVFHLSVIIAIFGADAQHKGNCYNVSRKDVLEKSLTLRKDLDRVKSELSQNIGWVTVFHAFAGIGRSVYDLWQGPQVTYDGSWTGANFHYKSQLVEQWEALPIQQVQVLMYDKGKEVVNVIFRGENSTKMSWFSLDRVISSSWRDFPSGMRTAPCRGKDDGSNGCYVNLTGWGGTRRFYINRNFGGCPADNGWMVVIDGNFTGHKCNYDEIRPRPVFLYSKHQTFENYKDLDNFGQADTMLIKILA